MEFKSVIEKLKRESKEKPLSKHPLGKAQPTHSEKMAFGLQRAEHQFIAALHKKRLTLYANLNKKEQFLNYLNEDAWELANEVANLEAEEETGVAPKDLLGYFVTINPKENDLEPLKRLSKGISRLSGVSKYMYVFEQTGTASAPAASEAKSQERSDETKPLGHNTHVHMLLWRNRQNQSGQPKRLKKQIKTKVFKQYTKNAVNLQIKTITSTSETPRIRYLLGFKAKGKDNRINDSIWRKQNGLKDYYANGKWLEKRNTPNHESPQWQADSQN